MANTTDMGDVLIGVAEEAAEMPSAEMLQDLIVAVDHCFLLIAAALIFFMQAGFAFLETGAVRNINTNNVILKNYMDFGWGVIIYWLVGFWITNGCVSYEPVDDDPATLAFFFLIIMFANTADTIISGAVAERFVFGSYMVISTLLVGFVWPALVYWVWNGGFLAEMGVIDFAGSGVVHAVGGLGAIYCCAACGARKNRWSKILGVQYQGQSIVMASLGVFILWFGWFGFNAGSAVTITNGRWKIALQAAANTTVSPCVSIVIALIWSKITKKRYDFWAILNGCLAGLVGITAGCATTRIDMGIVCGIFSPLVYIFGNWFLSDKLKIDDVVSAGSVHGLCGLWGVIAAGLFADADLVRLTFDKELVWADQMIAQLALVGVIVGWVTVTVVPVLLLLKYTVGVRVKDDEELVGLDFVYHKGLNFKTMKQRTAEAAQQMERERMMAKKWENYKKKGDVELSTSSRSSRSSKDSKSSKSSRSSRLQSESGASSSKSHPISQQKKQKSVQQLNKQNGAKSPVAEPPSKNIESTSVADSDVSLRGGESFISKVDPTNGAEKDTLIPKGDKKETA